MSLHLAGCVLFDDSQKIYLLHRNKKDVIQWELPGGKIDPGEDAETTAVREIKEELGVTVSLVKHVGSTHFEENGTDHMYTWFLATIQNGNLSICEPQTFDDLQCFSVDELPNLKLSNNMKKLYEVLVLDRTLLSTDNIVK
jgi:mutator protein MutT